MKKIYFLISIAVLFSYCSKDFLKPYEDRIIGNWHISDVDRIGIGGSSSELPFQSGSFSFKNDGSLTYTNRANETLNGYWEIDKRTYNGEVKKTLHVTAVDFNTQAILSEFYDEMDFRSTNHFVGKVSNRFHTFVTHFRR